MVLTRRPIVFLHLPKTAGQSIHNALSRALGPARVSPIRVHSQVAPGETQFPPGHALYSGHLDWDGIGVLPRERFLFTVLRDPRERIASFYFFLRRDAAPLSAAELADPVNLGRLRALLWEPEDYFFGGDAAWHGFIRDHYDNFYTSYFATRRFRGGTLARDLTAADRRACARVGLAALDAIHHVDNLAALERDLARHCGLRVRLANRFDNASDQPRGTPRWPALLAMMGSDRARRRLESFVTEDEGLLSGLASRAA